MTGLLYPVAMVGELTTGSTDEQRQSLTTVRASILSGEPVRVVIDQGRVEYIGGGGCSSNEMIEQRRNKLNTRCSHVPLRILAWPPWDTLKQSWEYCLIDSADVLPGAMTPKGAHPWDVRVNHV